MAGGPNEHPNDTSQSSSVRTLKIDPSAKGESATFGKRSATTDREEVDAFAGAGSTFPVSDAVLDNEFIRQNATAGADFTVTFAQAVKILRVVNFDPTNRLLVKKTAISGASDAGATAVGIAPVANVPCTRTMFWPGQATVHLFSAGTGEFVAEGYF